MLPIQWTRGTWSCEGSNEIISGEERAIHEGAIQERASKDGRNNKCIRRRRQEERRWQLWESVKGDEG